MKHTIESIQHLKKRIYFVTACDALHFPPFYWPRPVATVLFVLRMIRGRLSYTATSGAAQKKNKYTRNIDQMASFFRFV